MRTIIGRFVFIKHRRLLVKSIVLAALLLVMAVTVQAAATFSGPDLQGNGDLTWTLAVDAGGIGGWPGGGEVRRVCLETDFSALTTCSCSGSGCGSNWQANSKFLANTTWTCTLPSGVITGDFNWEVTCYTANNKNATCNGSPKADNTPGSEICNWSGRSTPNSITLANLSASTNAFEFADVGLVLLMVLGGGVMIFLLRRQRQAL